MLLYTVNMNARVSAASHACRHGPHPDAMGLGLPSRQTVLHGL